MLWGWAFIILALAATTYVYMVGNREAKFAITTMVLAVGLSAVTYGFGEHKWLALNQIILIVDGFALLLFMGLAARSSALWPIFLVGWQLTTVAIHIVSLFAKNLMPDAYGIGQGLWAYLQFATIFGVTFAARRRTKQNSFHVP